MQLSIVTTLYYSAPYVAEFCARISAAAAKITSDFEIILVNDGSPDDSLEVALSLYENDPRIKVVDLSRNFGHHKAIMTGLAQAKGEMVFLIDSDLEEEPELLDAFYVKLGETGADVVYGVQQKRKGSLFERTSGELFYKLFNLLSTDPVPRNLITARLMSRRYVAALLEYREREIFLGGIWAITGFEQVPLVVRKHFKRSSTYSTRRKIALLVNSITSFSNKPLIFIFYLGCVIILGASVGALYLIVSKIFFGALLIGWGSLIVSVWMLGGLNIFCLGVIGIYVSKIFTETKQRPYTTIRRLYARSGEDVAKRTYEQAAEVWHELR